MSRYNIIIQSGDNETLELIALLIANQGMYSNREEILTALKDGEISLGDDQDPSIIIDANKAEINFKDYIYMDLPNVFDDPSDKEMFELFKSSALVAGSSGSFEAKFEFLEDRAGYYHMGDCKFNGKKIEYFDNVAISHNAPIGHNYSAELNGASFINEKKEAFFALSGDPAPEEMPVGEEYFF